MIRSTLRGRAASLANRVTRRTRSEVDRRLGSSAAVLAYHSVRVTTIDPWNLAVAPEHFEQQMRVLREFGRVVPLVELLDLARHRRARAPHPTFAITFDDGYHDNATTALPVLERHDLPATVFIPTAFVGAPAFWWDRAAALTMDPANDGEAVIEAARSVGLLRAEDAPPPDDRRAIHDQVYRALDDAGRSRIDERLDAFESALPNRVAPPPRPMTADELVELASHPLVTIGAHTVDHPDLRTLSGTEVDRQLRTGLAELDEIVGPRSRRVLAYPHGATDRMVVRRTAAAGFRDALTTDERWVSPLDGRRRIPRLHPKDVGGSEFSAYLRTDCQTPA